MPNHNIMIYEYVKNLLKESRSKSVYYETLLEEKENEEEYIQKLEIVTNKKIIKAEY